MIDIDIKVKDRHFIFIRQYFRIPPALLPKSHFFSPFIFLSSAFLPLFLLFFHLLISSFLSPLSCFHFPSSLLALLIFIFLFLLQFSCLYFFSPFPSLFSFPPPFILFSFLFFSSLLFPISFSSAFIFKSTLSSLPHVFLFLSHLLRFSPFFSTHSLYLLYLSHI